MSAPQRDLEGEATLVTGEPLRDLEGKVALITGGTRGIGRAISLALGRRGAAVVVCYLRRRAAAEETRELLEGEGIKVVAIRAHVGDKAHLDALFGEVLQHFGKLDILVSNAATGVIGPLESLDERAWAWTLDSNARALFLCAKGALPLMGDGGHIVALSSVGATRVLPGYSVVGISKAAVEALVRYLAVELAPRRIRVNAVSPGVVDTEALAHFPMRDEMVAEARARTPAGRLVTPEDVAQAVDFLTSSGAAMITGQTLVVDGGASLLA